MEKLLRSTLRLANVRTAGRLALNGAGTFCACSLIWEHLITVQLSAGPSMYPTFDVRGDWLLISRLHRNGKGIEVGDIVRFGHPNFQGVHVAKRVVGMPGDFVCQDQPLSSEIGKDQNMIQVGGISLLDGELLLICDCEDPRGPRLSSRRQPSLVQRFTKLRSCSHGPH